MKKRIRLFSAIATLCLCFAVFAFGVYSAVTITYKTLGTVSYEIEDTFVEIETRVYSTSYRYHTPDSLKAHATNFENSTFEQLDSLTTTGFLDGQTTNSFNKVPVKNTNKGDDYEFQDSDYKYTYSSVGATEGPEDLELSLKYKTTKTNNDGIYTFFVISKLTNKSAIPLYVFVPTTGENKYVAPDNSHCYKMEGYKELTTLDSSIYIVFAMAIDDITVPITESEFVYPVVTTKEQTEIELSPLSAQEKVYKSSARFETQYDLEQYAHQLVKQGLEQPNPAARTSSSVSEVSEIIHEYDDQTGYLVRGVYTPTDAQNNETYFIVLDIKNLQNKIIYTKLSDVTTSVAGMSCYVTDSYLRLLTGQSQRIVLAYTVADVSQLPQSLQLRFNVQAAETPYSYADIGEGGSWSGSGFLTDYEKADGTYYSDQIRAVTFTNNSADFDVTKAVDSCKVGNITNEDGTTGDMMAYFIPNGDLFDVYAYAPVNTIYTPEDCFGFLSEWFTIDSTSIEAGSYDVYWTYKSLEYVNVAMLDVTKTKYLEGFFLGATNLKQIDGLNTWDTSNAESFYAMFLGCSSLEEVDLSSFTFESMSHPLMAMGMLGVNDVYIAQAFEEMGDPLVNAQTREEKIYQIAYLLSEVIGIMPGGSGRYIADQAYETNIQRVICPKDATGLIIGLSGEDAWVNQLDSTEETHLLLGDNKIIVKK